MLLSPSQYDLLFLVVQVTVPVGRHDDSPISVSFIASHGTDKFLLDTILDMYSSLQEVSAISSSLQFSSINGNMDAAELLKEKVHSLKLFSQLIYLTSDFYTRKNLYHASYLLGVMS